MRNLFQLAFRPFFFLGASYASVAVFVWIAFLSGWGPREMPFDPVLWHSHEMVYGFAVAIVVGFVLTAAQNWTGIRGVHGKPLILLVLVWLSARFAIFFPIVPRPIAATVDLLFIPISAYLLVPYLRDRELKTERVFFLFFALLLAGNSLVHLDVMGYLPGYGRRGISLGLDSILLVIVFMGGRVIPFFTESSVARAQPRVRSWIETASHVSAAAFLIGDVLSPASTATALAAFGAALLNLARLAGWQVRRVRRIPLVWVLHLAYLWLVIGFALSGSAVFGVFPKTAAVHAFTVGAIGVIIYGMITRVSLGHTGRRLHPRKSIVLGYVLLAVAAVIRVFGPVAFPTSPNAVYAASGALWIAAFTIFVVVYGPMLFSARIDGKPG